MESEYITKKGQSDEWSVPSVFQQAGFFASY